MSEGITQKESFIHLYQYGPSNHFHELPSFDPRSLAAQTYMKFVGVTFIEVNTSDHFVSPWKKLPFLNITTSHNVRDCDIVPTLASMGYDLDTNISRTNQNTDDIIAWSALLNHSLYNVQLFEWFCEPENYDQVISTVFSNAFSFPLSWWMPRRIRKSITQMLDTLQVEKSTCYTEAEHIYDSLSKKLGNKKYLYGDQPSSLDALMFGYLATQYYAVLPVNPLHKMIANHDNLVSYVNNIASKYFGNQPVHVDDKLLKKWIKEKEQNNLPPPPENQVDELSARCAIALGIGAFVLFIATQNIQFPILVHYLNSKNKALVPKKLGGVLFTGNNNQDQEALDLTGMENTYEKDTELGYEGNYEEDIDGIADESYYMEESKWTDDTEYEEDFSPEALKTVGKFYDHNDEQDYYVEDDNDIYDWDEGYLEEMKKGVFTPGDEDIEDED